MKRIGPVIGVALAVSAFVAGAFAADAVSWIGAAPSHRSFERYEMSIGVTASQQPRRPARVEEERQVLNVPDHYGTFVGMTGDSQAAVFWYRDAGGALRNVVVREPAAHVYKILTMPTARYEVDVREQ